MHRSVQAVALFECPLLLHWTHLALPVCVVGWQYFAHDVPSAALALLVILSLYGIMFVQASVQLFLAEKIGLGVREIVFLPFSVLLRLNTIAERPTKEINVYLVGLLCRMFFVAVFAGLLVVNQIDLKPIMDFEIFTSTIFLNRLFWVTILFTLFDALPAFPNSMGFMFRAALALNLKRIRATEITSRVGSFLFLASLTSIFFQVGLPYLPLAGLYLLISSQQELSDIRYFYGLRQRNSNKDLRPPAMVLPAEQVVDVDSRPATPNFTGFTYNPRAKLWIEWKNGQPVSASALIGS
jgi:hypothetical protein